MCMCSSNAFVKRLDGLLPVGGQHWTSPFMQSVELRSVELTLSLLRTEAGVDDQTERLRLVRERGQPPL